MGRDDEIQAIVEIGRRTRKPAPRWLWLAATLVGVICATGFAVAMLGHRKLPREPPNHLPGHVVDGRPAGSGLGIGLVIGAGAGLVIGFSIARQRRNHSSRNNP